MHVRRCPNTLLTKMLFAKSQRPYQQDPWINIAQKYLLNVSLEQANKCRYKSGFAALVADHACSSLLILTRLLIEGFYTQLFFL